MVEAGVVAPVTMIYNSNEDADNVDEEEEEEEENKDKDNEQPFQITLGNMVRALRAFVGRARARALVRRRTIMSLLRKLFGNGSATPTSA